MIKHFRIKVNGDIGRQGYRFRTLQRARQLCLKGLVSETPTAIVVEAEGEEDQLMQLVGYFEKIGTQTSPLVIEVSELPIVYYEEFRII